MPALDTTAIINWAISGLIGLVFGSIGAWYTHRLQLKRDNLAWQHEKEKFQERFEQEKTLLELQFQHKVLELEKQIEQQKSNQVRTEILKGLDNPEATIKSFSPIKISELMMSASEPENLIVRTVSPFLDIVSISKLNELLSQENDKSLDEFRVSFNEMLKALDAGKIMPDEFQVELRKLIVKTVNQNQDTG